jgi:uncharacterized membrane protein YebE (DUF533 family)
MSAQSILDQMLKSGMSLLDSAQSPAGGVPRPGLGQLGTGLAAGGVLGLLLGTKRGRSVGGSALKYGSVAALGAVAFRAYSQWQTQQATQVSHPVASGPTPRTVNLLPAPEVETHSRAMLKALIAAAKSDGHLDDAERGLIDAEMVRLQADESDRAWMAAELQRPLDPADVARAGTTPELAAEMYLASLLVIDDTSYMERAYLDEFARQLKLPATLKADLEQQASSSSKASSVI